MPAVSDHGEEIDGLPVFWRSAPMPPGREHGPVPLYLHGVPSNSDEWIAAPEQRSRPARRRRPWRRTRTQDEAGGGSAPAQGFLERSGGLAVDLPGFGRSGKPGSRLYTIEEYDRFIEGFLDHVGVERVGLVVHDWGAVGLAFAQRLPERVARLVVINAVPLLAGYRWHRTARVWRTPVLGELLMGSTNRFVLRNSSRESNATRGPMPEPWLDSVLDYFDQGTQRAILRLYRSSPADVLAAAGERLGELRVPALVVWGTRDPYIPARFGRLYAEALPDAELLELADAGHWPWLDRPDLVERVVDFLSAA